jgi:hypothetical protein
VAMISLTLATAAGVRTTGALDGAGAFTTSAGAFTTSAVGFRAAVAIVWSLLKLSVASLVFAKRRSKSETTELFDAFPSGKIRDPPAVAERTIRPMGLLEAFAAVFFRTFGITQPSDRARRGAAWFLLGMLFLVLLGLIAAGYVMLRLM